MVEVQALRLLVDGCRVEEEEDKTLGLYYPVVVVQVVAEVQEVLVLEMQELQTLVGVVVPVAALVPPVVPVS
jgi:hypothetical protein